MIQQGFNGGRRWGMVCWAILCLVWVVTHSAVAQPPPKLSGSLSVEQGVHVLRLWGTPHEAGFAHGYLLADDILKMIEGVLLDPRIMPEAQVYESKIRAGLLKRMILAPEWRAEMEGILAGVIAKAGTDGLQLERFGRGLDVDDLIALNTLADWNPSACSSFAAWGQSTTGGEMIVARNLDYFDLPGVHEAQLFIAYTRADPLKKRFVSISWPGLVGVYTGMNEDGVFAAMHDVTAEKGTGGARFTPRSLALRHVLETARLPEPGSYALRYLKSTPTYRGNNFILVAPFQNQAMPAVVFEYDGDQGADGGVTMRQPLSPQNLTPKNTIACTNHYRIRARAVTCDRYQAIVDGLRRITSGASRLDVEGAFAIIKSASLPTTVHTVIALPNEKRFEVCFAKPSHRATESPRFAFELSKLLAK